MERVRARSCLAVGAIALAVAATAAGAVAAPPRDLTPDLAPVAARVPVSPGPDAVVDDEEHPDPTQPPSEDMASAEPMDMGGHATDPSPSAAPGHGHGAEPSPEPAASDDHGAMPGMDDEESASHAPSTGGHDEAPAGGHDDSAGGHDDEGPAAERPRAVVLGGFVALNGIALAGAAVLRRRDRAAAALKARRTPTNQPQKDASR